MNVKMVKIVFAALAAVFAVLFFTLGTNGHTISAFIFLGLFILALGRATSPRL